MRIDIPEAFKHFGRAMEWDPQHPEAELRIDIPAQMYYINAAAWAGAKVIRVRFSNWKPKRRLFRRNNDLG